MSQWHKGHVQWFDKSSGEGVVVGDDGASYYVHYSTIISQKSRTRTLEKAAPRKNLEAGIKVKFQIYENLYSRRVDKVQEIQD